MADQIDLIVNGLRYQGWKSARVTRSLESIAGSFDLEVSERWDNNDPWPIAEGDTCRIEVAGEIVIEGFIDKRRKSGTATSRTLSYSGRDRAADLADCSAITKWTFRDVDVVGLATELARPHGIRVSVQAGLGAVLAKNKKIVVSPGDTGWEVISKVAAAAGVLVVSDGAGGILITRSSKERATSLVEGEGGNLLAASSEFDASDRFYRYLVSSQVPGTDEASGEATRIQAEATDPAVGRPNRVLLIRPDRGYSAADSKKRADWEARIRAARSEKVSCMVQGWRQHARGKLWTVGALSRVRAVKLAGVDGDMLISQVDYTISDDGGQVTQLGLVRPDAFTPEPTATVREAGGLWKELNNGGR